MMDWVELWNWARMTLMSIGYSGRQVDGFLECLVDAGVTDLVDIRHMPLSRKKGFSKTALAESLEAAGIKYHHVRSLGAPKDLRVRLADTKDFEAFSKEYSDLLSDRQDDLSFVVSIAREGQCCLLCVEPEATECHRGLVAQAVEEQLGAPTHHL